MWYMRPLPVLSPVREGMLGVVVAGTREGVRAVLENGYGLGNAAGLLVLAVVVDMSRETHWARGRRDCDGPIESLEKLGT